MLKVLRQNLLDEPELRRATKARDEAIQRVASNWYFLGPHRGDLVPFSFISESRPGGFLHAPPSGLALTILVFLLGITREIH
jgi:hypothetical protein